jgi:hypothetical protein
LLKINVMFSICPSFSNGLVVGLVLLFK